MEITETIAFDNSQMVQLLYLVFLNLDLHLDTIEINIHVVMATRGKQISRIFSHS